MKPRVVFTYRLIYPGPEVRPRSAQSMQVQEDQHKYDVGHLNNQLHDVEKDRNLLMVCV